MLYVLVEGLKFQSYCVLVYMVGDVGAVRCVGPFKGAFRCLQYCGICAGVRFFAECVVCVC